jgi:hypothetical protein
VGDILISGMTAIVSGGQNAVDPRRPARRRQPSSTSQIPPKREWWDLFGRRPDLGLSEDGSVLLDGPSLLEGH